MSAHRFLAHHFESPKQQYDSGRLGMWIFLLTEVLLFGGLFCAYAVYRASHPEIFIYANQFLSVPLGALNTGVLIVSSFTMAWAVRSAQCEHRRALIVGLVLTLLLAGGFLGVKGVEYQQKWREGLLWAGSYQPHVRGEDESAAEGENGEETPGRSAVAKPAQPAAEETDGTRSVPATSASARQRAGVFFSIYFLMTGLHGLHVVAGMGAIGWILVRSLKGHFNSQYFGPVDYVGLYWHLVDMIWIYLFPLLYLIH